MKTGRIFWGVFFVLIGLLVLLRGVPALEAGWMTIWRFWPLVLVLLGIALLFRHHAWRTIFVVIAAVFLALLCFGLMSVFGDGDWHTTSGGNPLTEEFTLPLVAGTEKAGLSLDLGRARFFVGGRTDKLLDASTQTSRGRYSFDHENINGVETIRLAYHQEGFFWRPWNTTNRAEIRLHDSPAWNIQIHSSASTMELDLRNHRVEDLKISANASSVSLVLGGNAPEAHVKIDAGVSALKVEIPDRAGCEVRIEGGLSHKKLNDFHKVASNTYRTENFDASPNRIFLSIHASVSSVRVTRY